MNIKNTRIRDLKQRKYLCTQCHVELKHSRSEHWHVLNGLIKYLILVLNLHLQLCILVFLNCHIHVFCFACLPPRPQTLRSIDILHLTTHCRLSISALTKLILSLICFPLFAGFNILYDVVVAVVSSNMWVLYYIFKTITSLWNMGERLYRTDTQEDSCSGHLRPGRREQPRVYPGQPKHCGFKL